MKVVEILIGIALFISFMTCASLLYSMRTDIQILRYKYEIMKENYEIIERRYNAIREELDILRSDKLRKQLYDSICYPPLYTLPIEDEDPNLLKLHLEWKDREHKKFIKDFRIKREVEQIMNN